MALQNDTSRIQYNGNNSTTSSYAIPFVFFENAHIKCVVTSSAGVDTTLALGSGYNVTGAANPNGGSLTTTAAVPTSSKVTIFREVPATQTTSYQEGGDFPAASHERALDKLTMIAQQTKRLADRALKVPETQNNPNDLPNSGSGAKLLTSNNGTLGWDENRNPPPYPATAGTQALVTAGSGASPSWQTMPAIATGPITATGSTTPRFLSDRFGEVYHVEDFGAKGDGITDDRAAIQAAVNAAVAANGGTVRFSANKTYLIDSVTNRTDSVGFPSPTFGFAVGSGNTVSGFGSSSMRILFDGNNATIRMTKGPPTNGGAICYICCRFSYIGFENLRFVRDRYFITGPGAQGNGVSFWAYDTNQHDQVYFNNCYFNNCHHAISFHAVRRVNFLSVRGKLKKVLITNCAFEYPFGAGRPANFNTSLHGWSGALVINGDTWIDVANFENCYADGIVGGTLPIENFDAMHGFLFPMPLKTAIRNCHFKHMSVECIKASDVENANVGISLNGNFTQPAVGQTLTTTVATNTENLQTMTVGAIYAFGDANYFAGRVGIYRLEPKPGGGNYTFVPGDALTLTRLSSDLYDLPSARDLASATGNVTPVDMATLERMSLQVTGCIFDNSQHITYQLSAPATGGYPWDGPSIMCDYELLVSNNVFIGGVWNVYCGSTSANHKQTVITGNTFYAYSINTAQSQGSTTFIEMRKSNVLIANNAFVIKESRAVNAAISVGGHEIVIINNLITVQQPSAFGTSGVDQTEPMFIIERNGGPWRIVGQDNYLRDMGHYVYANHTPHVGSFYGNIRSTIGRNDGGTVSTFKTGKPLRSANGQIWNMNVTNDGELEVFQ